MIGHRFGVISESGLRGAPWFVVEEKLGVASGSKKSIYDEDGIVYGHPAVIDIDTAATDKKHIIIENRSRVGRGDILELHRIGILYEEKFGVKPALVIIGEFTEQGVRGWLPAWASISSLLCRV